MNKKIDYLDLKMGVVEQYTMVVERSELPFWKTKGWLEWSEVGLSEEDKGAFLLYGEISDHETLIFGCPETLTAIGSERLIGRTVIDYSAQLGTYGMGGAGFFGLRLDNLTTLVYAVWGSNEFTLINDKIFQLPVSDRDTCQEIKIDDGDLESIIMGAKIIDAKERRGVFDIVIRKDDNESVIKFIKNRERITKQPCNNHNYHYMAYKKGKISDYILLINSEGVLII